MTRLLRACGIPREQLITSLRAVWLVLSVPLLAAVVLPMIGATELIGAVTPVCVWKSQFGRECTGCGLTTAFLCIGHGDWPGAARANAAGVPLFAMFAFNSVVAAAWWVRRILR